jgi:hypothetical protein
MRLFLSLLVITAAGCAGGAGDDSSSRDDTGYVSDRTAEFEALFSARVHVPLPDLNPQQLAMAAAEVQDDFTNAGSRSGETVCAPEGGQPSPDDFEGDVPPERCSQLAMDSILNQLKYTRNPLNAVGLNVSLERFEPTIERAAADHGGLEVTYHVQVDALVSLADLAKKGQTPEGLVDSRIETPVPLRPVGLFERIGLSCATDPDTGRLDATDIRDINASSLFYFFDPGRDGCTLGPDDVVAGTFYVKQILTSPTVYPEYDRLVADGRIDMSAIFGQIHHGDLIVNGDKIDPGFEYYDDFKSSLESVGFRKVSSLAHAGFPKGYGERLAKTYPGGLLVQVDMYSPISIADNVPREQANDLFEKVIHGSEIVYYGGHAFFGSLEVLKQASAYPPSIYQIFFMDACWSYAYYTKQVFANKTTPEDPTGFDLADVVNNTRVSVSETPALALYQRLFEGAAAVRRGEVQGKDAERYSWNQIVAMMNDAAEKETNDRNARRAAYAAQHPEAGTPEVAQPELYGISGARTNRWQPLP